MPPKEIAGLLLAPSVVLTNPEYGSITVIITIMNKNKREVVRRSTSQREIVLNSISMGKHPSARDIYDSITRRVKMSFGTVYRNLQILEEEKEIVCVKADPQQMRYDKRMDRHYHLHCRKCGNVFDVPSRYHVSIDREASKNSGFVVESHTIVFEGLCQECADAGR